MKKTLCKILILTLMLPTFAMTASGCNDEEYSSEKVISIVNDSFTTDPELISKTNTQKEENGDLYTEYIFKTDKGIEFTVKSELNEDYWGFMKADITSNYMQALYEHLNSEILELEQNNGVTVEAEFQNYGEYIDFTCTAESFDDLSKIVTYLWDLYELTKSYLPDYDANTELFSNHINISYQKYAHFNFDIDAGEETLIHIPFDERFDNYPQSYVLRCSQIAYAELYRDEDNTVNSNIPRQYIRKLYVNGEEFASHKYSPCFAYDEKTHQYYTTTTYGVTLSYNGGVADHLHREIVTDYLDGSYSINKITETSEYKIGKDKFKVKCPMQEPWLAEFYKNGEKLEDITMITDLDFWHCDDLATYFYLMSLEDYAFMLNMDYEVDQTEGAVYLTSK